MTELLSVAASDRTVRDPAATRMPAGPKRAAASGPAPFRVLLLGGGAFMGVGVDDHQHALGGTLAHALGGLTAHGVDVDIDVADVPRMSSVTSAATRHDLTRYDVVAVSCDRALLGMQHQGVRATMASVRRRMVRSAVLVLVLGPDAFEGAGLDLLGLHRALAGIAHIAPLDDVQSDSRTAFARWGRQIAAQIAASLDAPRIWTAPVDRLDERTRLLAVDRSVDVREERRLEIRTVVDQATEAYGTAIGALSIVGRDNTVYSCSRGMAIEDYAVARELTICNAVLPHAGGLIVGDVVVDPRFAELLKDPWTNARFYAGYRVRDLDGHVIGVLCVFDPEPRPVNAQDLVVLRDLAHIVESLLARRTLLARSEAYAAADD